MPQRSMLAPRGGLTLNMRGNRALAPCRHGLPLSARSLGGASRQGRAFLYAGKVASSWSGLTAPAVGERHSPGGTGRLIGQFLQRSGSTQPGRHGKSLRARGIA
jgi:hypothetical protein